MFEPWRNRALNVTSCSASRQSKDDEIDLKPQDELIHASLFSSLEHVIPRTNGDDIRYHFVSSLSRFLSILLRPFTVFFETFRWQLHHCKVQAKSRAARWAFKRRLSVSWTPPKKFLGGFKCKTGETVKSDTSIEGVGKGEKRKWFEANQKPRVETSQ